MNFLASKSQLRASLLRWSLFLVPLIVLLGFFAGQVGGGANTPWFQGLEKPGIYPPPATFGIVWTILYVMIGLSVALVASSWGAFGRGRALALFAVHFVFNLAWTPVFFGMQNMSGGLIVIGLAIVTLVAVIWAFRQVRGLAAMLLLPYLAWLIFAAALNYQFLALNPDGGVNTPASQTQRIEI